MLPMIKKMLAKDLDTSLNNLKTIFREIVTFEIE